jgi:hypothetical protein
MSNSSIIYEHGTRRDLEECGCGPITVLSMHLPGGNKENHENHLSG